MTKILISLIASSLAFIAVVGSLSPAQAANCVPSPGGGEIVSASCSFSGTVNGVDNGNLTISAGDLTLVAGQTLVFNQGYSIIKSGGRIIKGTGSQIKKSSLWMTDADNDNYSPSLTQIAQDTAPTNGKRRNLIATITQIDPNDADANIWLNFTCYLDADNDTYTTGASVVVGKKTACNDPVGHQTSASGTADCYDSNANAKPGQTTYFTTHRGDSSFDYDCNGTSDMEFSATSNCI